MSDRPANPPRRIQGLGDQSQKPATPTGSTDSLRDSNAWTPVPISNIEETGLSKLNLADLILKVIYFAGDMMGHQVTEIVKLPFTGVVDQILEFLKRERFIEVRGSGGFGEAGYRYVITDKGADKARDALERSQYASAAPVSLRQYIQAMQAQNRNRKPVHQSDMQKLMENLVVSDEMLDKVGPAVNSGRSIFLYGPPGNGKTTIAERVGRLILGDDLWIPYAIDVDGQIIQVFDFINHEVVENPKIMKHGTGVMQDPRWICIKRPMIMVGGELTMAGLDLQFDEVNKFYEAPYQVKANGGMFLIDDFGRQVVRPVDLLNRWIVPLEKGVDFLTLNNGRKIEVPFFVLIVFSTNLDPKNLVDEAFLRRIRFKIEVGNPTLEQFRQIFQIMCRLKKVPYDEQGLAYLIKKWYIDMDRDLRMVHPRDILSQLVDIANYQDRPATLAKDLIDAAAASYFVEL
ncbi:MAG: ATP-binding protein [Chitinophagaceae bacterium]|nr:ATP-binding protein [Anaerolineae bacterium]